MYVYNAAQSIVLPAYVVEDVPIDAPLFYYQEPGLDVQLYVKDSTDPATVWINGEKYPFSYGCGYSPTRNDAPYICICDINQDAKPDILLYGSSYRTELRQDVYLSNENDGHTELGDITWNPNDTLHTFVFNAEYMDNFQIHISVPSWNIDEIKQLDENLATELTSLGLYEDSILTEYGREWKIDQLQGKSIGIIKKDSNTYLYYEALIEAGYSEYTTGYGFRFEYQIENNVYNLTNISFIIPGAS